MRVGGRGASGDGKIPTDPAPVVQEVCAGAGIGEGHLGTDRTPDCIVIVLEIIVAACEWDPLFDLGRWHVVFIHRASHRVAVSAEDFGEAEAEIGGGQERVTPAIEDTACRVGAVVADHDLRGVKLLTGDIGVGLLDEQPGFGHAHDRNHCKRISHRSGTAHRCLADGGEDRPRADAVGAGGAVRCKIGRVEDSVHGDEGAAIAGDCVIWEELMNLSVIDVLDLAAQLVAQPNVSKRTRRGDIHKWSHRGRFNYPALLCGFGDGAGRIHREQAPRRADRGYNQPNGRAHRQFPCHTSCKPFHFWDFSFS